MLRKFLVAGLSVCVVIAGSTACATKKYVKTSVGEVNDKVDSLGKSLEETQERTRKNEGRISEVDQKAQAAAQQAQQAGQAAQQANQAAQQAQQAGEQAQQKYQAIEKANARLVYQTVLSEDQGNFKFGQVDLPDTAKQKIDEMVGQLKQDPKNVWIEIEGHTDNVGDSKTNERIGLERALAVQRYLYTQYQIPLHKMNVISYGEDKPIAPNTTSQGRAQNRRVVIKVLA